MLRVSAVSYLNTCPLTWGLLHGRQSPLCNVRLELPAVCAESMRAGTADVGLVPVIEAFRQNLETVSDVGIASDGEVRSIFLLHRTEVERIGSVALDSSSRTSVALMRIVLLERYGVQPMLFEAAPDAEEMLKQADAALLIGDPALRLERYGGQFGILDLGSEWKALTGLPMVYAVWAGAAGTASAEKAAMFRESYEFGRMSLEEIIGGEAAKRKVPSALAREYLNYHIRYELDARTMTGMREFERIARLHHLV